MSRYKIYITSTVSSVREVEADSLAEAQDLALDDAPYAPGFSDYEFSDVWECEDGYEVDGVFKDGNP